MIEEMTEKEAAELKLAQEEFKRTRKYVEVLGSDVDPMKAYKWRMAVMFPNGNPLEIALADKK